MRALAVAVLLATVAPAGAQPAPCADCARGDALIDHFALQAVRGLAAQLAAVTLGDPVTADQYAHLVELRRQTPALGRLGALDDTDLDKIAASLCQAGSGACFDGTARTLRCLADRCRVDLPPAHDLLVVPSECQSYRRGPQPYGVGLDWGTGWQRSRFPNDARAWAVGIQGRVRLGRTLGLVARIDRSNGRDAATDSDGNGHDDTSTGAITRIVALGGPSIVLAKAHFDDTTRFLRLDLLGGYLATRSQVGESGPAAGFDLAYQIWGVRFGVRMVQAFGSASDATLLLAHLGMMLGAGPPRDDDITCSTHSENHRSSLALGLDFPLSGAGFSSQLGYLAPGLGMEGLWHVSPKLDAIVRGDLVLFPGYDRDRMLHQAALAGLRIDHAGGETTGYFTTIMAGYSLASGLVPTTVGSGPILDVSFAWGGQSDEGAAYIRLHARSGIGPDNLDYRAVFLSAGVELRLDPQSWRDRG